MNIAIIVKSLDVILSSTSSVQQLLQVDPRYRNFERDAFAGIIAPLSLPLPPAKFQIAPLDTYPRARKDSFRRCRYSHARYGKTKYTKRLARSHDRIADEVRDPEKSPEIEGNRRGFSPSGTPAAQVHRCVRGDGGRFLRPCRWM